MIIECYSCQARFRLDESKIKGRAARVQCRRCGNAIYVEKPEAPAPAADSSLDLRSLLAGPAGSGAPAARPSPAGEAPSPDVSRPAPKEGPGDSLDLRSLVEAPPESGTAAPAPPAPPASIEEPAPPVEQPAPPVSFEEPAPPVEPPPSPAPIEEPEGLEETGSTPQFPAAPVAFEPEEPVSLPDVPVETVPAPIEEPAAREERGAGPDLSAAPIAFEPEEPISFADVPVETTPAPGPAPIEEPAAREETGAGPDLPAAPIAFEHEPMISFADVPPESGAAEPPREEPPGPLPLIEPTSFAQEPPRDDRNQGTMPISEFRDSLRLSGEPGRGPADERMPLDARDRRHESRVEELQDELRGLAGPAAPTPAAAPPPLRSEPAVRRPASPVPRRESRAAHRTGARPRVVVLAVLFLLVAGGGAYLGFTPAGKRTMEGLVARMDPLIKSRPPAGPAYAVENLVGFYDSRQDGSRMFVVRGQVKNLGDTPSSAVRIQAAILGAGSREIAQKSAYAGNIVTTDALKQAGREKIEAELSNRFGENLVNMDVPPGKAIPFLVVFFDAPAGIEAFRVEPREGDQ